MSSHLHHFTDNMEPYSVYGYKDVLSGSSGDIPEEQFAGWSATLITSSSDSLILNLQAVAYMKSYIVYHLDGGTTTGTNPDTYYEGKEEITLADASKEGYTFDGWYSDSNFTTKVTSISDTQIGKVTLYAKFTYVKKKGVGSVTVSDVNYGKMPEPVVTSSTNGTDNIKIEYKQKGASDDTYTSIKPTSIGEYIVRVAFAETEKYLEVTATDDFSITYLNAPQSPYNINGTMGENNYYTSEVTILPAEGYLIADSLDGTYKDKIELTKSSDGFFVYLINASTGEKTSGIKVPEIKIDDTAPTILNATSGETIYGDQAEIVIKDDNLREVLVNGETVEFKDGQAVLQLSSNQGEEEYEIICIDQAGNRNVINVVVTADWMKAKIIPLEVKVKLLSKYSYTLGSGRWKVSGDNTTYAGGSSFYVKSDGEYSFSNVN